MTSRLYVCWGRLAPFLVNLILFTSPALAASGNQADVQLHTDLSHMVIRVDQAAPMPPGGCTAGHTWHTAYGGCRRQEIQSETGQCLAGWSGTRTRYRTAYILQANANDVAYGAWGPWQDSCTRPRLAGVVDTLIAAARGAETGGHWHDAGSRFFNGKIVPVERVPAAIVRQMRVYYGTMYGVTIHRPTATLNCVYASATTSGSGNSNAPIVSVSLMPPGQSINNGYAGHCQLSNDGQTAQVYGSCDRTSGGDSDHCISATRTVRITATSACTVTTETSGPSVRGGGFRPGTQTFNLCE